MNRVFWIPQTHKAVQQQRRKLSRMVLCRLCVACWLGFPGEGQEWFAWIQEAPAGKRNSVDVSGGERHCKSDKLNRSSTETMLAKIYFRSAFGLGSAIQHFCLLLVCWHPCAAVGTAGEGGWMVPGLKHPPIPQNFKLQKILQPNG